MLKQGSEPIGDCTNNVQKKTQKRYHIFTPTNQSSNQKISNSLTHDFINLDQIKPQLNPPKNRFKIFHRNSKISDNLKLILRNENPQNHIQKKERKRIFFKQCKICEMQINHPGMIWVADCSHKYDFCESCLHHYVIFQVGKFEEVSCPCEDCEDLLNIKSTLFGNLPVDIQKKYKRIHEFYERQKDPSLRPCSKKNCEGTIKIEEENPAICSLCKTVFCKKCLLQFHLGICYEQEVNYFQNNLHFRQCSKCKMVVEKNQGCNHITCRCKHQFCYVCGSDWKSNHRCNQQIVQLQAIPQPNQNLAILHPEVQQNSCVGSCFKNIFKGLLFFLGFLIVTICFIGFMTFFAIWFVVCLLIGIFIASTKYICREYSGLKVVFLVLIHPVFWPIGIYYAVKELFWTKVREWMNNFCGIINNSLAWIRNL